MISIVPIAQSKGVDASKSFAAHFRLALNELSMEEHGVEILEAFQFPHLFQPGFVVAFGYRDQYMVAVGLKPLGTDAIEVWTGRNGKTTFVCQIARKSGEKKKHSISRTQFERTRDMIMHVKTHVRDCKCYQPNILSHKTFHSTCRLDMSNFIQDNSVLSGNDLAMTIVCFLSIDDCFTFSNDLKISISVPNFNLFQSLPTYPTKLGMTEEISSLDSPRRVKRRKVFHVEKSSFLNS